MSAEQQQEGIQVAIRVRPLNEREITGGQSVSFQALVGQNAVAQLRDGMPMEGQTYLYDKVFDEKATTAEVYTHIARDAVKNVANGINGTIFAYGQTSSGKTHTMLGGGDQRGVLEMAAEDIFRQISESTTRDFLLRVSFVEIYNETIRDLLSNDVDASVSIREDPKKGVYCDAIEVVIADYDSIIKALRKGTSRRTVEATNMNDTSSRSHTIFKLVVESKESPRAGEETDGAVLVASLNLVDLAGSESVKHTGATGQRAKEGGKINQSLLSLSRVIHALSQQQPGQHVSFRDSKLTRLLQPSLSGNAKMAVVCCITPSNAYIEETRSTLQFASRAKLVSTHATVNEVLDDAAKLRRLKRELDLLKEKQRASESGNGNNCMSEEEAARVEIEKNELLGRLNALQREKDQQQTQLECLRELVVRGSNTHLTSGAAAAGAGASGSGGTGTMDDSGPQYQDNDKKKKRKRQRDTWCPGAMGVPSSPMGHGSNPVVMMRHGSSRLDGLTSSSAGDTHPFNASSSSSGQMRLSLSTHGCGGALESSLLNTSVTHNEASFDSSGTTVHVEEVALLMEKLQDRDNEIALLQQQLSASMGANDRDGDTDQVSSGRERERGRDQLKEIAHEAASAYMEKLQTELSSKAEVLERLQTQYDEAKNQISTLSFRLEQAQGDEEDDSDNDSVATVPLGPEGKATAAAAMDIHEENEDQGKDECKEERGELAQARALVASLQEDLVAASATTTALTADLAAVQQQLLETQQQLQELSEAGAEAGSQQEEIEALKTELASQMEASQTAASQMSSQIEAFKTELAGAMDVAAVQIQMAKEEASGETERWQTEVATLTARLEAAATSAEQHTQTLKEMETRLVALQAEKESIEASAADNASFLNDQLFTAEETVTTLQGIVEGLERDLATQTEDSQTAASQMSSQIETLNAELTSQMEESQTAASQMSSQIEALNAELASQMEASQTVVTLQGIIEGLEGDLAKALEDQIALAEDKETHENEDHTRAMAELEQRVTTAVAQWEEAKTTITTLQGIVEGLEQELAAMTDLTQQQQQREDMTSLTREAEMQSALATAAEASEEKLREASSFIDNLTGKIDQMECELATARHNAEGAMSELQTLKDELTESSAREAAAMARGAEIEGMLQQLQVQVTALEGQLEGAVGETHAATASSLSAEERAQSAEQRALAAEQSAETSTQAVAEAEDRVAAAESALSVMQTRVQEAEQALAQAQAEQVVAQAQSASGQGKAIGASQEELDQQRRDMERTHAQMHAQMGVKEAEISRLVGLTSELSERATRAEQVLSTSQTRANATCEGEEATKKRVMQLQTTVDLLTGERDGLAKRLQEAEKEFRELSGRASVQEERLQGQLKTQSEQLTKLEAGRGDLSNLEFSIKALESKVATLKAEKEELQRCYEGARDEITSLGQQIETQQTELEQLRRAAAADDVMGEVASLKQQLSSASESYLTAVSAKAQVERDMNELSSRFKKTKDESAMIHEEWLKSDGELKLLQKEKEDLSEELERVVQQVADLTQALTETEETLEGLAATEAAKVAAEALVTALQEEAEQAKSEVLAANQLGQELEAEVKDQESALELARAARAELLSRLDVAAQEVKGQQAIIEDMQGKIEAMQGDEHVALMKEMNVLLEAKMEAEAKAETAEAEAERLQGLLSAYDRNAAQEQALIVKAAEAEMDSMRRELDRGADEWRGTSMELVGCREREQLLLARCQQLEKSLQDKEAYLVDLEGDLDALRGEGLEKLTMERDAACAKVVELQNEHAEVIAAKDARMVHLEASKLTQDQMDKIKVLKEEHKKSREDVKTMKKQLQLLKKAYDDLKESKAAAVAASAEAGASSSSKESSVQELTTRLEHATGTVKSLKEKLKECASQLQEYEIERNAVIKVLETHGVDTTGLSLTDNSCLSEDANSLIDQDLGDAVNRLVAKLSENNNTSSASSRTNNTLTAEKIKSLQESLTLAQKDADEAKAMKVALEKRLEATKASARGTRAEAANVSAEVDALRLEVAKYQADLEIARNRLSGSEETVNSEVQALEEENLDLMQENKELRKEISVHRLEVEKLKATMIKQQGLRNNNNNGIAPSPFKVSSSSSSAQDNIENMPLNIQNAVNTNNNGGLTKNGSTLPATAEKVVKKRVLEGGGDDGESYSNTNNSGTKQARRMRKARPLVSTMNGEGTGATTGVEEESAGECAQS